MNRSSDPSSKETNWMAEDLSRRRLLTGLGTGSVAGIAGCTGLLNDSENGENAGGESDDNRLRISIIQDPGSAMNPYITNNARWDWMVELVHDKLLFPMPFTGPVPGLATDVTQEDDHTWTATIREGVKWHDGEPFTPEDVAFSYQYLRDGPHSRHAHHVNQVPHVTDIAVVDDQTVEFVTEYPTPTLGAITFTDTPVLPEHIWSGVDNPNEYTEPAVGTGPYEIVEYQEGERARFEATGEWFYGNTIVDEIVVEVIPDPSVTFTQLQTGEIDSTVRPIPPETLQDFRGNDAVEVIEATQLQGVELRLNFSKLPFREHDFRRALSRAIDIDAIVDIVMLGEAISGTEGFPHPQSPWTAPDLEIPYEPDKARTILDNLGYEDHNGDGVRESPDGEPLSFELNAASNEPQYIRAGEIIADQLTDLGINITVQTTDFGTIRSFYGNLNAYDMYISSSNFHLAADPDQFLMNHRGGPNLLWNTDPTQGLLGDHDADPEDLEYPEYETLQQQYFDATTQEEMVEVYHELNRLHNRQPVAIPLWYPMNHLGYRPDAHELWAETPGQGIAHKYSFIEPEDRGDAITEAFY